MTSRQKWTQTWSRRYGCPQNITSAAALSLVIKWGKLVPARFIPAKLGLGNGPELIAGDAAGLLLCSYLSFFICFDNLVAECASLPMLPRTKEAKVQSLVAALAATVSLRGKTGTLSHLTHVSNLSHTQSDGCSLDIKQAIKEMQRWYWRGIGTLPQHSLLCCHKANAPFLFLLSDFRRKLQSTLQHVCKNSLKWLIIHWYRFNLV